MPAMTIKLDGDNAWPELQHRKRTAHGLGLDQLLWLGNEAAPIQVTVLDVGMASGRPSVAIRFDLPDGSTVVSETSARLFCTAARAIMARHPNLFED